MVEDELEVLEEVEGGVRAEGSEEFEEVEEVEVEAEPVLGGVTEAVGGGGDDPAAGGGGGSVWVGGSGSSKYFRFQIQICRYFE